MANAYISLPVAITIKRGSTAITCVFKDYMLPMKLIYKT